MAGANGANGTNGTGKTVAVVAGAGSGLNFDELALVRRTETITKGTQSWLLRSDVPARLMVERILMKDLAERVVEIQTAFLAREQAGETVTRDDLRGALTTAVQEYEADLLALVTAVFQHTLPETTSDEIAHAFTPDEQKAILDHFFPVRMNTSSQPPDAGSDGTSAPEAEAGAGGQE